MSNEIIGYLGIDPGLGGAIATIIGSEISILPMPVAGKEIDIAFVADWLQDKFKYGKYGDCGFGILPIAYIEAVHSMPKQGVSSSFKFGFVTGAMHGIIRAFDIPLYLVTPQAWKKEILTGTDKSKQACIDWCLRAYPNVKLFKSDKSKVYNDGMADALAIAEYGRRHSQ